MESVSSTHETLRMWPSGDYFVANILCAVIFGEKASKHTVVSLPKIFWSLQEHIKWFRKLIFNKKLI